MDAVIIGDADDPHTSAVAACITTRSKAAILDVAELARHQYLLSDGLLTLRSPTHAADVTVSGGAPGWIRRLAPADWQRGVVIESREAAVKTSWLTLLTAVIRTCGVRWLTAVDSLVTAENKLVQQAAAKRVGIRIPKTVVTNDRKALREELGDDVVLKPLGPGHYFDNDEPRAVFTATLSSDARELELLASAPFLAQRRIAARAHMRIVTVGDNAWAAELDAAGLPTDWRAEAVAHHSFTVAKSSDDLIASALAVAAELKLGYTSQDWIRADDGDYLLDVNPSGQWLFLPSVIADGVAHAIANWLQGDAL